MKTGVQHKLARQQRTTSAMTFYLLRSIHVVLSFLTILTSVSASMHHRLSYNHNIDREALSQDDSDPLPRNTREHWMHRARDALVELTGSPCPFGAFGTAIVNHTGTDNHDLGELVCIGANAVAQTGNPTLHGEMAAISNCTQVLASQPYNLSPAEIQQAWRDLSLYTTAEACSMCSTAIAWGQFREYIYATSIWTLIDLGWTQNDLGSREVLRRSPHGGEIRIVGGVLEHETDELFGWQFQGGDCPQGCSRTEEGGTCGM